MRGPEIPLDLLATYRALGQEHVLRFWGELEPERRRSLAEQLAAVDLPKLQDLAAGRGIFHAAAGSVSRSPAPVVKLGEEPPFATRKEAIAEGERLLSAGKVGIFLVAGGQGSRLGFEGPKGCLSAGPLSGKSIFQLHAEKIAHLSARYGVTLPWFVMTSPANDAATRAFFEEHRHFGLEAGSVFFFPQAMLPALDDRGKLILESKDRIFLSPDGHGGVYSAFLRSGHIEEAERRGIEHLFYFQVDNILIRIADPLFIGLHALAHAEMSLKVLRKSGPYEKIGAVVVEEGKHKVIEYSDLSAEEAERHDAAGELAYWAGSIAIHAFHLPFFRRVAEGSILLPYHVARKKIPAVDSSGLPAQVEGRKFETFVFDALPAARAVVNLEVRREEEFAPVKNRTGVDSLESAQALLVAEHARWLREAGVEVDGRAEVSPLVALGPEDLGKKLPRPSRRRYPGDIVVDRGPDGKMAIQAATP